MLRVLTILLLLCGVARADLSFVIDQAATDSLTAGMMAFKPDATWSWGVNGARDARGSFLHFTDHTGRGGWTAQRDDSTGLWPDVTVGAYADNPRENRPHCFDFNGDGFVDFLHTGNESSDAKSLISNPDGTFSLVAMPYTRRGEVLDLNGDGLLDVEAYGTGYGKATRYTYLNTGGEWDRSSAEVTPPPGIPQSVLDELAARYDDRTSTSNRYSGPRYWEGDLDGDGNAGDVLVSYGGSYGGNAYRLIRVCLNGELAEGNAGLPTVGVALFPIRDLDGDGRVDVVVQHGDGSGIYLQKSLGQFEKQPIGGNFASRIDRGSYLHNVHAYDFDADGDLDLVIHMKREGTAFILENTGETFTVYRQVGTTDGEGLCVFDYDGDGDDDVITWGTGTAHGWPSSQKTRSVTVYQNQANVAPIPDPDPDPTPDPTPQERIAEEVTRLNTAIQGITSNAATEQWDQVDFAIGVARMALDQIEQIVEGEQSPDPNPDPDPAPDPDPQPIGFIPVPPHDVTSQAWQRWETYVDANGTSASGHALLYAVTGEEFHRTEAIAKAQARVDADTVGGNQYLKAGPQYADVFETLAWCNVPDAQALEWAEWGRRHLGATDGSVPGSLWAKDRWARNNPANNYYHSFIVATSAYAMATGDVEWLDWLKSDRLPRMFNYYATTPEGGSREGTGYGESHRSVFAIAKLWRDYDGTEVLPQGFIDNSLRYWTHATTPGHGWVALIGDHTRTHGRTDGYHRDIIDNALQVAMDPEAIAIGQWQLANLPQPQSAVFYGLELQDWPQDGHPPETTEYYAKGAGHFFSRESWEDTATYVYFTAGEHDEAHQQEDQGAYAVWARGQWQTCSDSPWTHGGIEQDVSAQNVIRFPSAENVHNSVSTLTWLRTDNALIVEMDLTPAVVQNWQRYVQWKHGWEHLRIRDVCDTTGAEFGFEKPSLDDTRAPYASGAEAISQPVEDGFRSVITW